MKIVLGFTLVVGLVLSVFVFGAKITFNTGENGISAETPKIGSKIGEVDEYDIYRFTEGNITCFIVDPDYAKEGSGISCVK